MNGNRTVEERYRAYLDAHLHAKHIEQYSRRLIVPAWLIIGLAVVTALSISVAPIDWYLWLSHLSFGLACAGIALVSVRSITKAIGVYRALNWHEDQLN